MRRPIRITATSCVVLLLCMTMQPAIATSRLKDISGNWAAEHVNALVNKGIVGGYPDGTFRPNRTITRAEFAKIVVKAFQIGEASKQPFRDVKGHWAAHEIAALSAASLIKGYGNDSFGPDRSISRAESIAIVVRALDLGEAASEDPKTTAFSDVPADHWAAPTATAADRLDILPPYYQGRLRPDEPTTRAEAAALVNGALRLQVVDGVVDYCDPAQYALSVKTDGGALRDFSVSPSVTLFRNTARVPVDALQAGDTVHVVADRFGTPVYVKARGVVTKDEVVAKVSSVTRGLLTPEQLRAAVRGDWRAVAGGFQVTLYNQLLDVGATPLEAEAIMEKDWSSLSALGQDRLGRALGKSLGVSSELVAALLNQNWPQAKSLAEVEATELLLSRLLFGANPS